MSTVDRDPIAVEPCPCGKGEYVVLECMPDHGYARGLDLAGERPTCSQCALNYGVPLVSGRTVEIAVKQLMGDKRQVVCGSGRLHS